MLDSLKIGDYHATALLAVGSEFEVFEGDIPETPKDRLSEAHDLVSFAIDAASGGEIDDEETEQQINTILELAGVDLEGDKNEIISYGDAPEDERVEEIFEELELDTDILPEDGDGEDDNADDDAPAFDVDDIIDDWSSLKLKDAKAALSEAAEEEGDDELEYEQVQALLEYEKEQDKPRPSIVKMLEELIEEFDEPEGGDEEPEGDPEPDEEPEGDESGGESDEPWEGYDDASIGDIKEVVNDEDRTVEELEYVLEYEQENKERKTLIKRLNERLEELREEDDGGGEEEPEEEKPKGRRRARKDDPDESGEVDDAVAEDDEKEKRSSRRRSSKSTAKDDFEENLAPHFADLISEEHATEQAEKLGLKPQDDEYEDEELPSMPDDISKVDHEELSNLLLVYTAAHSSASWYAARDYVLASGHETVADYYEDIVLEESDAKNKEAREAESKTDDRVVYFRAKQKKHYQNYVIARDAKDSLKRRIETISRVGGFKGDDDDASDLGASGSRKRTRRRS